MKIPASELTVVLRAMPSESLVEVRDRDLGALIMVGTPHECQLLAEQEHVEGIAIARTGRLKYLKLTVDTRKALKALRRKLYATGRTVAEASQLISRLNVPGGGVVYAHITKRTAAYEPVLRRGMHPTYAALRLA
jgi:hypothetical protein